MIPQTLAITPSQRGPWCGQLHRLSEVGVDAVLIRLLEEPAESREVAHKARAAGLDVWVRLVESRDLVWARAEGFGVHLPSDWPREDICGVRVSRSTHCRDDVRAASLERADMCMFAPVFSPNSKPNDQREPHGIDGLLEAVRIGVPTPILALGGLSPARVPGVLGAGARGVAALTAFFDGLLVDASGAAAMVDAVRRFDSRDQKSAD